VATARIARTEDASRVAAKSVLLGAGAASLVAVAFTLAQAGNATAPDRGMLTALACGASPHHALLSYLFGIVIVAITVSAVAGLLGWPS
jgi:uncharacterized membrane protein